MLHRDGDWYRFPLGSVLIYQCLCLGLGQCERTIVRHFQREKLEVSISRCRTSLADVNFAHAHCRCSVVGKKQLVCVDSRSSTLQTLSLKEAKSFKATLLQVKTNLRWPKANTKLCSY